MCVLAAGRFWLRIGNVPPTQHLSGPVSLGAVPPDRSLTRFGKSSAELAIDKIDCSWQVYHFHRFPSAYQDCLIILKYQRPLKMCLKLEANFLSLLANSKNLLQNICQYIYSQTKSTIYYLDAGVILNTIKRLLVMRVFRCKMAFIECVISITRYLIPFHLLFNTTAVWAYFLACWLDSTRNSAIGCVAQVWNSWKWKSGAGRSWLGLSRYEYLFLLLEFPG